MRRGVTLLCLCLLGGAAFLSWAWIKDNARRNPGGWSDPYFRISEQARQTYRLERRGRRLLVIMPHASDLDPKASAAAQVPVIATVQIGGASLSGIAMTAEAICGGALRAVADAARAKVPPGELRGFFAGNPKFRTAWISPQRGWAAACSLRQGRCRAVFLNPGWTADFPLERADLCHAPAMNKRLAALVEKWRRK